MRIDRDRLYTLVTQKQRLGRPARARPHARLGGLRLYVRLGLFRRTTFGPAVAALALAQEARELGGE